MQLSIKYGIINTTWFWKRSIYKGSFINYKQYYCFVFLSNMSLMCFKCFDSSSYILASLLFNTKSVILSCLAFNSVASLWCSTKIVRLFTYSRESIKTDHKNFHFFTGTTEIIETCLSPLPPESIFNQFDFLCENSNLCWRQRLATLMEVYWRLKAEHQDWTSPFVYAKRFYLFHSFFSADAETL